MKPGWQLIGGKYYYFGPKGGMVAKKWSTIGGKRYYFKSNGQMATGWTKIGGTYYYFNGSGTLDGSTIAKQGTKYYFVTPQGTRGANILDGVGVTAAMNSGTKLQVCFNYVVRNCRYMGGPVWPPRVGSHITPIRCSQPAMATAMTLRRLSVILQKRWDTRA